MSRTKASRTLDLVYKMCPFGYKKILEKSVLFFEETEKLGESTC